MKEDDNGYLVYKHTNKINGKVYIGITSRSVEKRWGGTGWGYNKQNYFANAINKYGWDNFDHEVLYDELTKSEACEYEVSLISKYDSTNKDKGYNLTNGGNAIGMHTKDTRLRISYALKKYYTTNNKSPMSDEGKERLRMIHLGKKHTNESKRKMSISRSGDKNHFYGKHHTDEAKHILSEKCRIASSGSNNPMAKRVVCNGIEYDCANDCADFYGIRRQTFHAYLNSSIKMPETFFEMGLKYINEDVDYKVQLDNKYATKGNSKKAICNCVVYDSIKECAEFYGFNKETFRRWLSGKCKMQQKFVELGLRYYNEDTNN